MSVPRLKMETGARETDVRDDRSRSGIPWRSQRKFKPHPVRQTEHICVYPDDSCHATVDKHERAGHEEWHRQRREWDEEWQAEVERIGDRDEVYETRIVKLEGQVELLTELLGRAAGRGIDAILAEQEAE